MTAPVTPELKRHYHTLSEKETGAVVEAVADLIVNYLEGRRDPARAGADEGNHERDRKKPDAR